MAVEGGQDVRNAVVQGESGWSTFEEREVKAKMAFVRKILWGGSMVAEEHVLLDCVRYEHMREEWRERWRVEKEDQDMIEGFLAQATNKWWNSPVIKRLRYYAMQQPHFSN
ncbi:hypothetical protein CAPTEDRAFT_214213 [Capitella teleta]|uniref:Uncharacterized protein n=1 Tax=Capitella teleta TaxID=283909 RepID=R7UV51_CAPTE|nr:hypothetical protein CAPTEDRAFT_214213 [Capitella teleta]|eukprot:ELU07271.1 hypothetical protein CAPTEDRAFT_214213 [Capitella teleta]